MSLDDKLDQIVRFCIRLQRKQDLIIDQLYRMENKLDQLLARPLEVDLTEESNLVLDQTAIVREAIERIPTNDNFDFESQDRIVRTQTQTLIDAKDRIPTPGQ